MDIGSRIRLEREKQNISQSQLARDAGISQSGLSAIENTTKNPSSQIVTAIAKALHIPVGQLLCEEEPDTTQPAAGTSVPYDDPDIRRLARAKKKMPPAEWGRMMKIVELGFEQYFKEEP